MTATCLPTHMDDVSRSCWPLHSSPLPHRPRCTLSSKHLQKPTSDVISFFLFFLILIFTLFNSLVKDSVASMNFLFLSWWRSSICSSSASSFLCSPRNTGISQPTSHPVLTASEHQLSQNIRRSLSTLNPDNSTDNKGRELKYSVPGAPWATGPGAWGPACAPWSPPSAHPARRSRWGSRWWGGGCAGSAPWPSASPRSRRRSLEGGAQQSVRIQRRDN